MGKSRGSGDLDGGSQDLGKELKAVRQIQGLSLSAVARPAKISAAYLQKLEAGMVKNPSPRVLHRLATVLDVSYGKLMELAGYVVPAADRATGRTTPTLAQQALLPQDLTDEEWRAVAAFIAYLREQRKKT
ncbi:hypothetical protein AMJ71_07735 [candidate division TA06 bacterium SM1_40]|uniref:HTH cro/C1-type domain-containing protein n=2 Tax=Bacteria division TA06 TaxID=1156500 RepID=A0A0S8JHB4_UNCT6|nr:MAG: hypothetical protein AMJ71_07735 [candidate division TA06 bacterium SM1_40]